MNDSHDYDHNILRIRGARQHNLKNVNVDIPKRKFVVITGPSGSGKSSLAFDTVYAEGQRRYMEGLSTYVRQFVPMHNRPELDSITSLSPTIAINQRLVARSTRSTVATMTEIYDYLRLLFIRIGERNSPKFDGQIIESVTNLIKKLFECVSHESEISSPMTYGSKTMSRLKRNADQEICGIRIGGGYLECKNISKAIGFIESRGASAFEIVLYRINPKKHQEIKSIENFVEKLLAIGGGIINIRTVASETSEHLISSSQGIAVTNKNGFVNIKISDDSARQTGNKSSSQLELRLLSFNGGGGCSVCGGLGKEQTIDEDLLVVNKSISISEGAIPILKLLHPVTVKQLGILCSQKSNDWQMLKTKWDELSDDARSFIMLGEESNESHSDSQEKYHGALAIAKNLLKIATGDQEIKQIISKYAVERLCSGCDGFRLNQEALDIKISGQHIGNICEMSAPDLKTWLLALGKTLNKVEGKIALQIIDKTISRLDLICDMGLSYISLSRDASSLSYGEIQRVKLISQIGLDLCDVIYVLDEPSAGLHPADNEKLIKAMRRLQQAGNTVITVEHDMSTIAEADYIIEVGPESGNGGGQIVAIGTPEEIANNIESTTGRFLSGIETVPMPETRRPVIENKKIVISGINVNNLKQLSVEIPLGLFVCITGVSGSGKSTLVDKVLKTSCHKWLVNSTSPHFFPNKICESITGLEYIDKIIEIDQSPIGKTPRSSPATYSGVFDYIRSWFALLKSSRARGYNAARFSFNAKSGRCKACNGDGRVCVEMRFMPDVYVVCDECNGSRYDNETLEIKFENKSIADVLSMSVDEAYDLFSNLKNQDIGRILQTLKDVGLGYIKLGQPATNLSGGEAQRVKLARELTKRDTGSTLYLIDEPTTGLHYSNIKTLSEIIHKLVSRGNTIIVVEHNLELIKTADYVIDLGPGGGKLGGSIITQGTPEQVAACKESITGRFLAERLDEKSMFLIQKNRDKQLA